MNQKLFILLALSFSVFIFSCGTDKKPEKETVAEVEKGVLSEGNNPSGIGKFKNIELKFPLDSVMLVNGEATFHAKCFACHKLTDEKLVGPGWKGVTKRRNPEWIMNFITNTQVMLDSDLVAQQLMITCVARMPNQNLSNEDARNMLEFMRKNDE